MLLDNLNKTVGILDKLIVLTKRDLKAIKVANHSTVISNTEKKEKLIEEFKISKDNMDIELAKVVETKEEEKNLKDVIGEQAYSVLILLGDKLRELKNINLELARFNLSVLDFYNSLVEKIFPADKNRI